MDKIGLNFLTALFQESIYGDCYHFAIALHRSLGWPIVGLANFAKISIIIHAGVKSPNGKIWDGRGELEEEKFIEPFTKKNKSYVILNIEEEDLIATGTVKESRIDFFQKKAQVLWPKLPWKSKTFQDKVTDFANELETLSRKHKLWVCGTVPTNLPIIFEGFDDEVGYEIKPTSDGNGFTINRMIG